MSWSIAYSDNSRQDLKSIYEHIAYELTVPEYAVGQVERIMNSIRTLEDMPYRNPIYKEEPWKSKEVRFLPVDNYIVFYLPQEENRTINIVRIIYCGRDMKKQMSG